MFKKIIRFVFSSNTARCKIIVRLEVELKTFLLKIKFSYFKKVYDI